MADEVHVYLNSDDTDFPVECLMDRLGMDLQQITMARGKRVLVCGRNQNARFGASLKTIDAVRNPSNPSQIYLFAKDIHYWEDTEKIVTHRLVSSSILPESVPLTLADYRYYDAATAVRIAADPLASQPWYPQGIQELGFDCVITSDPDDMLRKDWDDPRNIPELKKCCDKCPEDHHLLVLWLEMPPTDNAIVRQHFSQVIRCLGFTAGQVVKRTLEYAVIRPTEEQFPHVVELRLRKFVTIDQILYMTVETSSFATIIDLVVVSKHALEWGVVLDFEELGGILCYKQPMMLVANSLGKTHQATLEISLKNHPDITHTFVRETVLPA